MFEGTISFVIDDYGNIAIVLTPGVGGGLGASIGIGSTVYPSERDVKTMAGTGVKVGGSLIFLGMEVDDKGALSVTAWKPQLGADFHATINYSWVIILWEGETNED